MSKVSPSLPGGVVENDSIDGSVTIHNAAPAATGKSIGNCNRLRFGKPSSFFFLFSIFSVLHSDAKRGDPLSTDAHKYLLGKMKFKKPVKVLGTIMRKEDPNARCLCFPGSLFMVSRELLRFWTHTSALIPCASSQNVWDVLLVLLLAYTLIILPMRLAFKVMDYPLLDYIIDALFIVDIIINFFAPFEDVENRFACYFIHRPFF